MKTTKPRPGSDWIIGGGETGALIRSMDWSQTPLGPIGSWTQSLRTTVNLCLASDLPICIIWGPELVQLYNDGYRVICGGKHPRSMGQNFKECWQLAWPVIGAAHDSARAGDTAFLENQHIFLDRHGYIEETFFTFSFSPVRDETGRLAGLFHPVIETTPKMLADRRTRTLRDLASRTSNAKSAEEAYALTAETAANHALDLPFLLIYRLDETEKQARLAAAIGLAAGTNGAPASVELAAPDAAAWPLAEVFRSGTAVAVDDVASRFGHFSAGEFPETVASAVLLPITPPGAERPVAVVVAGISPRLVSNEMYRGFHEQLSGIVTTALANALAYESERKRAEALAEIDRAKTAFFSNVSHEFRTPLTLMLGPTEELLALPPGELPSDARVQLGVVHRNSLRLQRLVNSLLDFSRHEAGRIQASYEPADLATLTGDLASVFQSAVEKAGLKFIVDCLPLPEPVYVDRDMWEKIVLNLISNAFKFTLAGEIEVTQRDTGGAVQFSVRDTGTGLAAAELSRVFERFHRVQGAASRTHEGTGIGLALVQELVNLHGGSVGVESVLGTGSVFTVTIPTGNAHLPQDRVAAVRTLQSTATGAASFVEEALRWLPEEDPARVAAARPDLAPRNGSASVDAAGLEAVVDTTPAGANGTMEPARILLADDNADMRDYLRRLLGTRFHVETAPDGQAALELIQQRPPDLVITDVMMPGLDGFALVQSLRADERTRLLPIIMLSARAGEEARVVGLDAGADDYLIKPFSARELVARVESQLKLAAMRREAGQQVVEINEKLEQHVRELQDSRRVALNLAEDAVQAAEAVRESENRLRTMADSIAQLAWMAEPDGFIFWYNQKWYDYTGTTPEQMEGWGWESVHDPAFLPKVIEGWTKSIQTGEPFEMEFPLRGVDGIFRWFLTLVNPLHDSAGKIVRWFGTNTDIDEQKRIQAELELQSLIVKTGHEPILVFELDGVIVNWNTGCELLYGYKSDEAVGHSSHKLLRTVFPAGFEQFRSELESDRFWHGDLRHTTKEGREITVETRLQLVEIDGRLLVLEATRDISDRRAAEARLALVAQLGELIRRIENPGDLLFAVSELAGKHFDARRCLFNEIDLDSDREIVHKDYVSGVKSVAGEHKISDYSAVTTQEMLDGKTVVNRDSKIDPRTSGDFKKIYAKNGERAYVTVPLLRDGKWVASLWLSTDQPREWHDKEIGLLETIAERTWLAVEKLRSEAALRDSEERFAKSFNSSAHLMTVTTLDGGVYLTVNDAVLRATGYTREEMIGQTADSLGIFDPSGGRQKLLDAMKNGVLRDLEFNLKSKNGEVRILNLSADIITVQGQRCVLTSSLDITERKRAAEALRESEARFAKAFNSSPLAITITSLKTGALLEVNDTFVEMTRFSRDEAIGRTSAELGLWNKLSDRDAELQSVEDIGHIRDREYEFRMRDGSTVVGLLSAELIEIGGEQCALTVIQDITARKQAEEALRAAERRAADEYQALLSRIVPLGQVLGTARELDSIYRTVNEFVVSSMPCSAFFVSFYDAETQMRHAAFASGEAGEVDISKLPPMKLDENGGPNSQAVFDRKPVVVSRYMDLMRDRPHVIVEEDGIEPNSSMVIPMIVMNRVIGTIEVQAYEDNAFIEEHIIALGMVANLAAVAIENVRLIDVEAKAREVAESANRAKDEFLSILSHELRTPLNSILGWVRMLRMKALDEEQSEKALEVIDRNTRQQSSLIEDLLDVSRIISGHMRIEKDALDLAALVRESIEAFKPFAENKSLSLNFSGSVKSVLIDGDPVRLQQVITNLLQNAHKFTAAGGQINVVLNVKGRAAEISVEDTGIGIESEFLPYIFDRFRQADASVKRSYTGLGLGLTIVKNIADLHGGTIEAASGGKNKGAKFTLTLPLSEEFYQTSAAKNGGQPEPADGPLLEGARILLIDDDLESLMPVTIFLQRHNAEVYSASSGAEALDELAAHDFDVIVSDIGMPTMDGYQLMTKLRQSSRNAKVSAIALTAYASAEHRELALESGFQMHLAKPINFDALLEVVLKLYRIQSKV